MAVDTHELTVAVAGEDGSAVGSGLTQRPVNGFIEAIKVTYTDQPGTCDVTITERASGQAILTLTDANTSGWFYPRAQIDTPAGAAIADQYGKIAVDDHVNVAVEDGDAGSVAIVIKVSRE